MSKRKEWVVYLDTTPDIILFTGTKTKAFAYIKEHYGMRAWKKGTVRAAYYL